MNGHRLFRALAIVAFGATYVTILLGGNVIATGSGLGCPSWPMCTPSTLGTFEGAAGIEFSHRASAAVLSFVVLGLALLGVAVEGRRPVLRNLALAALAMVVVEALLGGVVIDTGLAVAMVLVHFALATVLFGTLLILVFLANLREVPRRWIDWARQASEARPALEPPTPSPTGTGRPMGPPAGAVPADP